MHLVRSPPIISCFQCTSHQADVKSSGRLSLAADAGKRLREEEEPSHNGAADRLDSKDVQERHYRGQRVETPSYPGSARARPHPCPFAAWQSVLFRAGHGLMKRCWLAGGVNERVRHEISERKRDRNREGLYASTSHRDSDRQAHENGRDSDHGQQHDRERGRSSRDRDRDRHYSRAEYRDERRSHSSSAGGCEALHHPDCTALPLFWRCVAKSRALCKAALRPRPCVAC